MGDKESVLHVGLSGLTGQYAISPTTSSQTDTPAAHTTRATINSFRSAGRGLSNIFRGQIGGVNCTSFQYNCASEFGGKVEQKAVGLEGIFARGPFKLMGEFSASGYQGETVASSNSYDTKTFYLETGYFITGEKYADSYKGGVFSSFKPKNNFDIDNNQWGAVELAFRIEGYKVDDVLLSGANQRVQGNLSRGSANNTESGANTYTAGIRWILNPNLVFKANYAYTKLDNYYTPIDITAAADTTALRINSESLFMTRMQYMF
jgi:phosphate-selective porin OprO/OprP